MNLSRSLDTMSNTNHSLSTMHLSTADLPNLPGLRRQPGASNPQIFKKYMPKKEETKQDYFGGLIEENSEYYQTLSSSMKSFPNQGGSFGDLSGRYSIKSQRGDRVNHRIPLPYSNLDSVPAFVKDEIKYCSFTCTYVENVPENLDELQRNRVAELLFHPIDNTMELREGTIPNSGLLHGKILRRHQVLKPNGDFFGLSDFYANSVITIYNHEYTIIDCSLFTRNFLNDNGFDFGRSLKPPRTTDSRSRLASREGNQSPTRSNTAIAMKLSKSFFEFNQTVLRFYGAYSIQDQLPPHR